MPFAVTWMDLDIITWSEVSQRKTNIIWYHIYVESKKKKDANKLTYKTEIDSDRENKLMVTKEERRGWIYTTYEIDKQ